MILKEWARNYKCCTKCGTTERKHRAHGLCVICYAKSIEKKHGGHERKRGRALFFLTPNHLTELYINQKKSPTYIAKEMNCSRQYVHKLLKNYNIPTRSKSNAREIALKEGRIKNIIENSDGSTRQVLSKRHTYNHDFFSSWSPGMAYVLGFIATDGCIYPSKNMDPTKKSNEGVSRITISQKHQKILIKILDIMGADAKIHFRKRKEYKTTISGNLYYFTLNSDKMCNDLIKIGITPNKSLSLKFPEIPSEYLSHFIRGCWDGDGSILYSKNNTYRAGFVSGSMEFSESLKEKLELNGIKGKLYKIERKNIYYHLDYVGYRCALLYKYLYHEATPEMYLERKYTLFYNAFKKYENDYRLK